MSNVNWPRYQALAELVALRAPSPRGTAGDLIDRRTKRKLAEINGMSRIKLPSGKAAGFSARIMREVLAAKAERNPVGRPPSITKLRRLAPFFQLADGVLIRTSTGKPPAVRSDGQCKIMVRGRVIIFSPRALRHLLAAPEECADAFEAAAGPWRAAYNQQQLEATLKAWG